ncbi:MAG: ABC transporter substrate-binding protein [Dehalococcoidia bacterium]|nr:ABC transporter substrate-binding protein [Dehalococcoidia bacterium]
MTENTNYWLKNRVGRRSMLRGAGLATAGLAGAALIGCGSDDDSGNANGGGGNGSDGTATATQPAGAARRGGTVTFRRASNVAFTDPMRQSGGYDPTVTRLYAETLLGATPDGQLLPMLAESWEVEPERVVLNLRQDVKFGDGTPFNAEAVRYTFERGQSAELAAPVRSTHVQVGEVETPDDYTAILHLNEPNVAFISNLAQNPGAIISPTAHSEAGDDRFNAHPVGAGPFKVERIEQDGESIFVRDPEWPMQGEDGSALPYLDEVRLRIIPEDAVSIAALAAGEIELDYVVQESDIEQLRRRDGIEVDIQDGIRWAVIEMIINKGVTEDDRVRKALNYAIDREESVAVLSNGVGTVAHGSLNELSWAYDPTVPYYDYDPDEAMKHLAAAGYDDPSSLQLSIATYDAPQAELAQAQLSRLGIRVEVEALELAVYQDEFRAKGNIPLGTAGGPSVVGDPDTFFRQRYGSAGAYNPGRPENPEFDELIRRGAEEPDQEARKEIYSQIQQMSYDWAYRIWVVRRPSSRARTEKLQNLIWNGYNSRLMEAWLEG